MKFSPDIFREYDIRGVFGKELFPETAYLLGKAFATMALDAGSHDVVVGRDNRLSSEELSKELIRGLTESGCSVVDIGLTVTPVFYYSRVLYSIDAGMIITASHNPPEFNGFKIALGPGTIYGDKIQDLRRLIEDKDFRQGSGTVTHRDPFPEYLDKMASLIDLEGKEFKVAVDCGNGAASLFAPTVLEHLGCEVLKVFCEPDGRFPNHFPDPVKPENLHLLRETVLENGCHLGVGFDGDGDRLGVIDDSGQVIWGDTLMILFWREILETHPGADAIIEVKCSQALVEEVERMGGKASFCRTGHSLIKAKLRELQAPFAGEMSGHMFFADEYYGYDDAIYATGRLLRILARSGKSLSQLVNEIPKYCSTPETRVACPERLKREVVGQVRDSLGKRLEVVSVDGVRALFPNGWGLIRASNTEPVLVLRCEADTPENLADIKRVMAEELKYFPEIGPVEW